MNPTLHDIFNFWVISEFDDKIGFDGYYIMIGNMTIGYVESDKILLSGPTKNEAAATMDDLLVCYATDKEMFNKLKTTLSKILKHTNNCKTSWHLCRIK